MKNPLSGKDFNPAYAGLLFIVFIVGLLSTTTVAQAIFSFSGLNLTFLHNGLQTALTSAKLGSSLDDSLLYLSGGFVGMADLTSLLIALTAIVGIVLEARKLK
ncbi:MAG: hypothetical protein KGI38_11425 [Thaumarchaeota archaeon]|nr:hypothetical protein [Nitrososphaerota archaeon]